VEAVVSIAGMPAWIAGMNVEEKEKLESRKTADLIQMLNGKLF
jgi:hypothetical protein